MPSKKTSLARHFLTKFATFAQFCIKQKVSQGIILNPVKLFCNFLFLFLLFNCLNFFSCKNFAHAETTYFARIENSQTMLYSSFDSQQPIFTLPQTYFVELLSSANDLYYYARYSDIYGYVLKSDVKPVYNTPQNPFLNNISFRVFVPGGANLRSSPYNLGATNLIYTIQFLETNFLYYGQTTGEEAISKKGNVWYYCKYLLNNSSYTGYVYAPLCDCLSTISPNTEEVEYVQGDVIFKDVNQEITTNGLNGLSQTAQTIIIVAISLPCLLFIYLLFKPTKMAENASNESAKKQKHRSKPQKISRLKHSDYFELDDDF